MQRLKRSAAVLLAMAACPFLAACETLGIGANTDTVKAADILRDVPKVENSTQSPCWQQRQIATQRAYIDGVVNGKAVKYHADCDAKKPPPADPKTS